jgi:hypothetical protein
MMTSGRRALAEALGGRRAVISRGFVSVDEEEVEQIRTVAKSDRQPDHHSKDGADQET